ncbi:hypothetical protein ACMD2_02975 [Ananas comosus]|uniref:Uncharacterized protein n=1 Tax=Ananas comosus TaxID=4615 RepID=A0A199W3I9_ANACO|nr:hypothetical protein ACMD2_02975 [Ananas comosus]
MDKVTNSTIHVQTDTTNSTLTKFKFEKDLQSTTVTNNNQTKGLGNTTFGEFEDVLHRCSKQAWILNKQSLFVTNESKLSLFVITFLLVRVLALLVGGRILVLLVFRYQIIHVALRLGELHFVHPFARVPMQEGLSPEHGRELLTDPAEHLLDRGRVPDERRGHLQSRRGDHHALVSILDQLVNGERGVVRLDDRVGDLRGGEDGEGEHHAVRVLLPYLRDEQRAHAGSRSAT